MALQFGLEQRMGSASHYQAEVTGVRIIYAFSVAHFSGRMKDCLSLSSFECCNKIPQTRGGLINKRHMFSHSSGAWECETSCWCGQFLGRDISLVVLTW